MIAAKVRRLSGRLREQARSHRVQRRSHICVPPSITVGTVGEVVTVRPPSRASSLPQGAASFTNLCSSVDHCGNCGRSGDCQAAFASRLAPTGGSVVHISVFHRRSLWERACSRRGPPSQQKILISPHPSPPPTAPTDFASAPGQSHRPPGFPATTAVPAAPDACPDRTKHRPD
ncbi:hypothetical protein PS914_04137 [Pseudomonas fluorescens]|nr:hypothetical protein PS914_04137 [Pseudomonas fluorescens]